MLEYAVQQVTHAVRAGRPLPNEEVYRVLRGLEAAEAAPGSAVAADLVKCLYLCAIGLHIIGFSGNCTF